MRLCLNGSQNLCSADSYWRNRYYRDQGLVQTGCGYFEELDYSFDTLKQRLRELAYLNKVNDNA